MVGVIDEGRVVSRQTIVDRVRVLVENADHCVGVGALGCCERDNFVVFAHLLQKVEYIGTEEGKELLRFIFTSLRVHHVNLRLIRSSNLL